MASDAFITEFRIASGSFEVSQRLTTGMRRGLTDYVHQRSDLSNVYYTPHAFFDRLKTSEPDIARVLVKLRDIPVDSVVLLHCNSYAQRYDYRSEETNMKAIVLSKEYDIGICTGRTFARHFCSDLMYADRFFSYRFGERKYWFTCYSSTLDDPQLISDTLARLFGTERGAAIFTELGQQIECSH